jgi:preprotein translocase subunit SecG
MSTFILVLIVVVAALLVVVILAQNPKGGGLASGFGGSSATQFMGVKKTGDFLESTTWVLAVLLLTLSLTANKMADSPKAIDGSGSSIVDEVKETAKPQPTPPPPAEEGGQPVDSPNALKP